MLFKIKNKTTFTSYLAIILLAVVSIVACNKYEFKNAASALIAEPNEALSGGATTVFDQTVNAFALPIPQLSSSDELLFFVGNSFFNQNWVQAPSRFRKAMMKPSRNSS